jgi:hypothetical protein
MALTKVTSAVIKDSTITDSDIGSTLTSAISGSTTALSSSVATRFDSRETDMTLATASIAAITASLGQPVNTDSNVTFGTITSGDINSSGTITATEIHTTFVSSSIAVASGSNIFGDDTSDSHQFTGSVDVSGSATIDGAVDMASTLAVGTYFSLKTTDDQANSWVLYTNTNDSLEFNYNGSGNAEVVVDNSGSVGIGTTNPTIPLVVGANGDPTSATIAAFINTNDGGVASIMIQNDAGGGSTDETNEIVSRTSNRRNGKIVFGREADQSSTANADSFLQLHTATNNVNNAAIHIDSSQRVGIGTTSPDTRLTIAEARQGNASDTILNQQILHLDDTTAWSSLHADKPSGGGINFSGVYNSSDAQIIFAGIRGLKENNTDGN